jgi:hypothetical protein
VEVTLHSDPVPLGRTTANATGVAVVTFTIPTNLSGAHTVEGVGIDPNGAPITVRASFTIAGSSTTPVAAARQLAFTGTTPVPFALGGITVLVVGAMLLAASRRRHRLTAGD